MDKIKELLEQLNLSYNVFSYRTDTGTISYENNTDYYLTIDAWEKTNGEQWANCRGTKYSLEIGKIYCRWNIERYTTNNPSEERIERANPDKLENLLKEIVKFLSYEDIIDREEALKDLFDTWLSMEK